MIGRCFVALIIGCLVVLPLDRIIFLASTLLAPMRRSLDGRLDTRSDTLPCFDPARSYARSPDLRSPGQLDVLIRCISLRFCRSLECLLTCLDACSLTGQLDGPSLPCLLGWVARLYAADWLFASIFGRLDARSPRYLVDWTIGRSVASVLAWIFLLAFTMLLARQLLASVFVWSLTLLDDVPSIPCPLECVGLL